MYIMHKIIDNKYDILSSSSNYDIDLLITRHPLYLHNPLCFVLFCAKMDEEREAIHL